MPDITRSLLIIVTPHQAVEGQFDRDTKISELLDTINNVYAFVDTIKSMSDLTPVLETSIELALKQTVECALFIREYYGSGFAGTFAENTFEASF